MTADNRTLPPALVLGVDTAIGLTVIRELGRHGVPVHAIGKSSRSIGRHSRYTGRFYTRPKDRPMAEWLPGIIADCGARVLLAISEGDLIELAALPHEIGGCTILTPRRDRLDIVLDKSRTLAAARAVGIDVPESWQPVAGEDFERRARAFPYPAILKWSDPPAMWARLEAAGIAFEKVEYTRSADDLLALLSRYDRLGTYPLVQGWCAGEGFGQMLHMADGRATLTFQHRRLREFPPSGGVSTLCESVPADAHRDQMARSEALLAHIGWEGPAMVEYRHDPATGRYWLMEINGRFWGSLPLASQSGAHFAWEHYRRAIDPAAAPTPPRYRHRRARYLVPDAKRLVRVLRSPGEGAGAGKPARRANELIAWLAGFLDPRTGYYVLSLRDPRPLLADLFAMVRRRAR